MERRKKLAAAVAGVIVTGSGLGIAIPSVSQAAQERGQQERGAALAEGLAEELGLDSDQVAAALETVTEELRTEHQAERLAALEERLAAAVEAGRLSQDAADEVLESAESGELRRGPHRHLGGRGAAGVGPGGGEGLEPLTDQGLDGMADSEADSAT